MQLQLFIIKNKATIKLSSSYMHYFQKVSGKTSLTKRNKQQRTNTVLDNKEENLKILQKKKKEAFKSISNKDQPGKAKKHKVRSHLLPGI